MTRWDVVVVGSGFGGAVTACRMAQAGASVLVLERGREWGPDTFPDQDVKDWFYDSRRPHRWNGWVEFHAWRKMTVATGAGVGGGSLVYANVFAVPPEESFAAGWPAEVTYGELLPYYRLAGRMMNIQRIPDNQLTSRYRLMREAVDALGDGRPLEKMDLAVSFHPDFDTGVYPMKDGRFSGSHVNGYGRRQGTCIHAGRCDVGCPVLAKNTLDLNYLALAKDHGAEIRPLHQVSHLERAAGTGWRVHFHRIDRAAGKLVSGSVEGARVVLAAGSLGSTEVLLRSRDRYGLMGLSPKLGHGWSGNGNFLTPAKHPGRDVDPTLGPTITAGIKYLEGRGTEPRFTVEEGGFPPLLRIFLQGGIRGKLSRTVLLRAPVVFRRPAVGGSAGEEDPVREVMPWFANGVDGADGQLRLGRRWYSPWREELMLDWDVRNTVPVIRAIQEKHRQLAEKVGGKESASPIWQLFKGLVTPHPLGGCRMAGDAREGVADHLGRVFGYENLYVADGALLPHALGINPSRTITALAERVAEHMAERPTPEPPAHPAPPPLPAP